MDRIYAFFMLSLLICTFFIVYALVLCKSINQSTLLVFDFVYFWLSYWMINWLINLIDWLVKWLVDWLIGSVISFLNRHFHLWFNLGHLNLYTLSDFDCDFWMLIKWFITIMIDWSIDWFARLISKLIDSLMDSDTLFLALTLFHMGG